MTRNVLFVGDDRVLRKHVARFFEREGYCVTTAGSLNEAAEVFVGGRFGTLVLDMPLPDGNGLDLLAGLHPDDLPERTVVLSGLMTLEDEARARSCNVSRVLQKPVDLTELVQAVAVEKIAPPPGLWSDLCR